MKSKIPHLVQYQGSKRLLASQIIKYMPDRSTRLIEPFSGVASISIAAAYNKKSRSFHINDINQQLIRMLEEAIERPDAIIKEYSRLWSEQFSFKTGHIDHFYYIRERFNSGFSTPAAMLYLLARCVKGSIRYGRNGKFNQSPDKRRHGANPKNMESNICSISALLKGKTTYSSLDYQDVLSNAQAGDLVYMDPPYQGVCSTRDQRYISGISFEKFSESVELLNNKNIDYIISYDGECGDKVYGKALPESLLCKKILLNAGLSTQSTLLGRKNITYESLYISKRLYEGQITPSKMLSA